MKRASVGDMETHFAEYVKTSEQEPVVVTRNGKPIAVLLGVEDEEELERLVLAYSPKLQSILDSARERLRSGAGIAHEDFWQDVESA